MYSFEYIASGRKNTNKSGIHCNYFYFKILLILYAYLSFLGLELDGVNITSESVFLRGRKKVTYVRRFCWNLPKLTFLKEQEYAESWIALGQIKRYDLGSFVNVHCFYYIRC